VGTRFLLQIANFQWSSAVLVHGRQDAKLIGILDNKQQPIQYDFF
jgi:hypothetical protein